MFQIADFNSGLPNCEKPGSPILKHLVGDPAFAHLEGDERERLEGARWLVRTIGKNCSLIDQGQDREVVGVLLSGWAFRYQTLLDGKRQILLHFCRFAYRIWFRSHVFLRGGNGDLLHCCHPAPWAIPPLAGDLPHLGDAGCRARIRQRDAGPRAHDQPWTPECPRAHCRTDCGAYVPGPVHGPRQARIQH